MVICFSAALSVTSEAPVEELMTDEDCLAAWHWDALVPTDDDPEGLSIRPTCGVSVLCVPVSLGRPKPRAPSAECLMPSAERRVSKY